VERSALLLIRKANLKGSATLPFVIPSEAEGSAVPRSDPGNVFLTNSLGNENWVLKQTCHPDRSVAKWRDLLFIIRGIESEGTSCPPLCHPERSRGICGPADPSWKCFLTNLPWE
jgi:hypothetical protein